MGPLNEFERRFLEMAQAHLNLHQANAGGPPPEYYGYPLQIGSATDTLDDGITHQGVIAIQSDAWFLLQYLSVGVILPTGSQFGDLTQMTDGGNLQIQITDTGAGEDLYNTGPGVIAPPAILVAGSPLASSAGIPYVFPTPRLIEPNTNILVNVTKLGVSGTENPTILGVYVMLNGTRVEVSQ
jgi:hypothetical protein